MSDREEMAIVLVPRDLDAQITRKLDEAYASYPEAEVDREVHHRQLVSFFHRNGYLPEFTLRKQP
jgi:hypothetical protein